MRNKTKYIVNRKALLREMFRRCWKLWDVVRATGLGESIIKKFINVDDFHTNSWGAFCLRSVFGDGVVTEVRDD